MASNRFDAHPKLIELQLLRHGETQNQLLSPLTDYLALCGDHPSTTVRFPLKHRSLLTRLRAMDYGDSTLTRLDQKDELSALVTDVLEDVPGLISELATCQKQLAHLSLASSAAELAMVPFELALTPAGIPGAGQPLCLQPHVPVCLTRRSRNVNKPRVNWRRKTRILMISSDAGGEIPVRAHYAALRKAIDPWLDLETRSDDSLRQKSIQQHLYFLHNPTMKQLSDLLKVEHFSHVHLLAHGAPTDSESTQFGVVMPGVSQSCPAEVVSGERLGEILGFRPEHPNRSPLFVSLAVCQSGRHSSVIMPGSSMAFQLHDKGIPVVVGSQFPLSFAGSIIMTRELYDGLLRGQDPRIVVWNTRRALHAQSANCITLDTDGGPPIYHAPMHDWASMTVYAEFPDNIDDILPDLERDRIVFRMTPRMDYLDRVSRRWGDGDLRPDPTLSDLEHTSLEQAGNSIKELDRWIQAFPWQQMQHGRHTASLGLL
ncbi:MAG: CHAT domain-containing protein, partial [Planctomycetaceae bacterium]|nr:CHAT domain-containing protein [Planctomycetaceae bacterium]